MNSFKDFYQLVNEGGAAGHMAHPFDLDGIDNGKKLLKLFDKIVKHIKKKSAAVKLDGVNVSVKLVDGPNGKEFALDRGSMKEIDLEGITISRLEERFPPSIDTNEDGVITQREHGMVKAGQILLSILNDALPNIEKELKSLRMWNDDTIFLNTEFIETGGTNVISYGKNFIAFHGVNKFKLKSTGKSRYSEEIKYNRSSFDTLIDKVQASSSKQDFDTHGVIDVSFKNEPDFTDALDSKIEIVLTHERSDTRTLGSWLNSAKNPGPAKITDVDGKKVIAMTKRVYQYVIGEENVSVGPLSEMFPDENDAKIAIDASIMWHATRLLGIEINNSLETFDNERIPVGEGIVIRDLPSGKTRTIRGKRVPVPYPPFKITGEFIIGGLISSFK